VIQPQHRPFRAIYEAWGNNAWSDWITAAPLGYGIYRLVLPIIGLKSLNPGDRLTAYIAVAAGGFAFVAVAFAPIAILVSLGPGESLRKLRAHDATMGRNFLLGTLAILAAGFVIVACGIRDSHSGGSTSAEVIATFAVALIALKVVRLTHLFWAILLADSLDTARAKVHRF
jgi:hypothetical protein